MTTFENLDRPGTPRRQPDPWASWRQWVLLCLLLHTLCVVLITGVLGYHYIRLAAVLADAPRIPRAAAR